MNRAQRRAQKKNQNTNPQVDWVLGPSNHKPEEVQEPETPGINSPPVSSILDEQISENIWHDRQELQQIIDTILTLSDEKSETNEWCWAYNHNCKYVDIRIDMRDGGFIFMNQNRTRINLEQLKWQYKSLKSQNNNQGESK